MAYLCFNLDSIPDLSLSKYSSLDESGVEGVLKKTNNFLRQLNRKGILSKTRFHILYIYDPDAIKGQRLKIFFISSGKEAAMLESTREIVHNSAISAFYDLVCNERVSIKSIKRDEHKLYSITICNHLGHTSKYNSSQIVNAQNILKLTDYKDKYFSAKTTRGLLSLEEDGIVDDSGLFKNEKVYKYVAALGKREFFVQPSVILPDDNDLKYYKVAEWEMNEDARLYNMFKLMQGLNKRVAFRVDVFSVDYAAGLRAVLPIQELRNRTSVQITKGASTINATRDENAEETLKQYNELIEKYENAPHFRANILAFSDEEDIAQLIVDAAGAEALQSGNYSIKPFSAGDLQTEKLNVWFSMDKPVDIAGPDAAGSLKFMPNLYLLDELRPFFSFPALHDGETIELPKETAPTFNETGLRLGVDENGFDVVFPVKLFKKHAFLAGVPGSGKTNSMLHLASSLWKDHNIPFLILEPAKKEYRALARIDGMDDLLIFSPSSGTCFPLHINPFEFPCGMSLSEHIRNLMSVFEGAFTIDGPTPFMIDSATEAVYREKGWYPDTINNAKLPYPTMKELYDKLTEEVEKTEYEGDIKGNLKSFLQVRIGSLLQREMGDVFNVSKSTLSPEEWLEYPALIELEAMGNGPANFLTLLLSTLIRESLKVIKSSDGKELRHVIFFEEAHNLIGPEASEVSGEDANPKLAATAYVVKMLAEVRALNEGIIIADQLPTVMAPEVIKNTGLKIGHRLTAEDDRSLLGGTMSANQIQLEQMATFMPGEALITFEGLLRPFKAQICQWENGTASYESPTNEDLVDIMFEKAGYKKSLLRSSEISCRKFGDEQNKLVNQIDLFMEDNDELDADIDKVNMFIKENNMKKEDFYTYSEDMPTTLVQAQEQVLLNYKTTQLLEIRLNKLFSDINELLVKEKGYLFQNSAHKKETALLLFGLERRRAILFEKIKNNTNGLYQSCINNYYNFLNEMKRWGLSKILADVSFDDSDV